MRIVVSIPTGLNTMEIARFCNPIPINGWGFTDLGIGGPMSCWFIHESDAIAFKLRFGV